MMKYPFDIISYVRKKTFSIEAHFTRRTDDKPLEIFDDTFSRFVLTVIENSKAATCNLPLSFLAEIRANTDFAYNMHMTNKYAPKTDSTNTSPAYVTKFATGSLKGKSPVDVLIENGEKGKEILNNQYKFLKDNLEKYPNNQKLMDAIKDAGTIDLSTLEPSQAASSPVIDLLTVDCRPLIRKKREDGLCFCYEAKAEWDSSKNYPVSLRVSNYYAPVEKKENGLLNVILSRKDRKTELSNEFNMTAGEWLHAVKQMENVKDGFERMYLADSFKLADKASRENRENNAQSQPKDSENTK